MWRTFKIFQYFLGPPIYFNISWGPPETQILLRHIHIFVCMFSASLHASECLCVYVCVGVCACVIWICVMYIVEVPYNALANLL